MKQRIHREGPGVDSRRLDAMMRVRKELGMTQTEFAGAIGMSKDAVASWECGRNRIGPISALRMSAQLQRNVVEGKTDAISVAELVEPRVMEFERNLRRRLGV
jgi:transcriptional regulator with XRE-family HTH domain